MLSAMPYFPQFDFVVAGAPGQTPEFYKPLLAKTGVRLITGKTYDVITNATAAMVTSGTATLETALLGTPQVVCYKANAISFAIAKRLVKIKFISLVNLLLNREAVRELIQDEWNVAQAEEELRAVLVGGTKRDAVLASYAELKASLGNGGASELTAKLILKRQS
jgi:lipid-A-disaccharide synthase